MKKFFLLGIIAFLPACTPATGPGDTGSSSSTITNATLPEQYTNTDDGYSISYPNGWTTKEKDKLVTDTDEFVGTSFAVRPSLIDGTKVSEARVHVAAVVTCPTYDNSTNVQLGANQTVHSTWSGVGAGNLYTGDVYTINGTNRCYVITFFTHQCNLGPDCGPNRGDIDLGPIEQKFRAMVESFKVL